MMAHLCTVVKTHWQGANHEFDGCVRFVKIPIRLAEGQLNTSIRPMLGRTLGQCYFFAASSRCRFSSASRFWRAASLRWRFCASSSFCCTSGCSVVVLARLPLHVL